MKTIVLTGGGTAGHVSPNLALIPHLLKKGYDIHYIGSKAGIERRLTALPGVTYHAIESGKLRRYFDVKNFSDPFRVLAACWQSLRLMKKIKPNVVFSKGGFVAVPVVWAAHKKRVPVLCHESDITPGLANRLSARYAKKICTTFPECANILGTKGILTGTPLRAELFLGDREKGLRLAGFTGSKPVLLMMGGSQGARAVNIALREALPLILSTFDVIHLCGAGNLAPELEGTPGYFQIEFLEETLPDALAAADIVLSRAGANALCEFHALKKPMVLVPLPLSASRGDQILNARSYQKRGLARVLPQEDITADTLYQALLSAYEQRGSFLSAVAQAPVADGTQSVLEWIEKVQRSNDTAIQ